MAVTFETASRPEGSGKPCQDRVGVFASNRRVVAVIADGAGGTSGGAGAATAVVEYVRRAVDDDRTLGPHELRQLLLEISVELESVGAGQSTAVIAVVTRDKIVGASVGDSGAWWVGVSDWRELTAGQPRKPLLGGGFAEPLTFECDAHEGAVMLDTDGVLKFAPEKALLEVTRRKDVGADDCCSAIIGAARLPGGALQDDASVLLVRWRESLSTSALLAWTESIASNAAWELISKFERRFANDLEDWICGVLPAGGPLDHGVSDGLVIDGHRVEDDGRIAINGWIWGLPSHALYPFEVRLKLGEGRLEHFELLFGDPAHPDGGKPTHLQFGAQREWMTKVSGP